MLEGFGRGRIGTECEGGGGFYHSPVAKPPSEFMRWEAKRNEERDIVMAGPIGVHEDLSDEIENKIEVRRTKNKHSRKPTVHLM